MLKYYFQAKETGPSGLEESSSFFKEPDLMLVSLVGGSLVQFGRPGVEDESLFSGVAGEDLEFLFEIGRTALKTANCLTASAEFFKMCFERESLNVCWFHMRGH